MKRRAFIAVLGGAAICPLAAMAQQRGVPVVGLLRGGTAASGASFVAAFRKGLSETGFVEGRNLRGLRLSRDKEKSFSPALTPISMLPSQR